MKIKSLQFDDAIPLGLNYEPYRHVADGDRMFGGTLELSEHSPLFVKLTYRFTNAAKTYSQLIPWARCDLVTIKETNDESSKETTRGRKAATL